MYYRYNLVFLIVFVIVLAPAAGLSALLLTVSGEFDLERVVGAQAGSGRFCLYGAAVNPDIRSYKLKLFEAAQPAAVIVGSSRVMQLREPFFTQRFVNLGGSAGTLGQLLGTIDWLATRKHVPELVLIGVDTWWFNPNTYNYRPAFDPPVDTPSPIDGERLARPIYWLLDSRTTIGELYHALVGAMTGTTCRFGVRALIRNDGFGPDGSLYPYSHLTGTNSEDAGFSGTLSRIEKREAFFEGGDSVKAADVNAFLAAIDKLEARGSHVVLFLTPFAPPVAAQINRTGDYGYMDRLIEMIEAGGRPVADFRDTGRIGGSQCEFEDGFHAGDVMMARILRDLAARDDTVRRLVDTGKVEAVIAASADRPFSGLSMPQYRPADHLGLGCATDSRQ